MFDQYEPTFEEVMHSVTHAEEIAGWADEAESFAYNDDESDPSLNARCEAWHLLDNGLSISIAARMLMDEYELTYSEALCLVRDVYAENFE